MKTIWKNRTGFWIIRLLSLLVTCTACSDENVSDKEKTGNTEHPVVVEASPKYYISSSLGSDSNDGLSEDKPWKTLNRINSGEFNPADSILLRCGDTWEETVTFNSIFQGSEDAPIVISSYGEGNRPIITHPARDIRALIMIQNADYLTISNLELGPFLQYGLRFDITDNKVHNNITIENLDVHDMQIVGIFFNARETPGYQKVTVRNCTGNNVEMLLAVGGCKDVYIYDCEATECIYGGLSLMSVEGGEMNRCKVFNSGTGNYPNGACGIYLGSNKNFTINDCEIAFQKRNGTNPDGEAIDFECNNINVAVRNSYLHDNDGCAIMFYDNRRDLVNEGCIVEDCLFENNGKKWQEPKGFEIHYTKINNNNSGIIRNNTFLLRTDAGFLTTVDPSVVVSGNKTTDGKELVLAPALDGQPKLVNSSFETPGLSTYERQPAGATWTFRGGGIAHNGSAWGAPTAPEGSQVLFLQGGTANVSQWVDFPTGTFKLQFKLAYRNRGENPKQGLTVYVDNLLQGEEIIPGITFEEYESVPFTVDAGYRLIELRSTTEGDRTVFVDDVRIVSVSQ